MLTAQVDAAGMDALLALADQLKGRLGPAAIVLGAAAEGRVHLVAAVDPSLVERGVKAGEVVKTAAQVTGGGGGGRDTMARAGGRDPDKLPEAIGAARAAIADALVRMRVLALDYGAARCGCAISDPTGTLATPIEAVERPDAKAGLRRIAELVDEYEVERVVVGLPLRLAGGDSDQTQAARAFAAPRGERGRGAGRALRRALHHGASPSVTAAGRARTPAPPPCCWRAGWRNDGAAA